jgi:prophage antirepressor-like protein
MEIVKAFNENDLHTDIVIKGTYDNPLFRASDIGVILEISNIRSAIQMFDSSEKGVVTTDTLGGTQEVTFLTEKGLYKVLFKSRKPIAEKFQNWVCDIIKEIRLKGKYELEKQLDQAKNEIIKIEETNKNEINTKVQREREQILLREFGTAGSIVYLIRVKSFDDGTYVIKIGESRIGAKARYDECKSKHGDILLLDCFAVKRCKEFENFLHHHEEIKLNNVTDLLGHEADRELFLIGKKLTYKTILHTIKTNIKQFNNVTETELDKLRTENETLRQVIQQSNNPQLLSQQDIIQELLSGQQEMTKLIKNLEKSNKEILDKLNSSQTKTTTIFNQPLVTLGPRLQQINHETMLLNKVYESVAECIKESNFKLKRPSIVKAVNENSVYGGYRWSFVDRNADPTVIAGIAPTKQTKVQNLGYIAKLNVDKTEILNVYIDRKVAAQSNGYASHSGLDNPVKNESLSNGHYYILYNKCHDILRENLIKKYGEPLLYKDGVGQYDADNNLTAEFVCKHDCIKQLKISDKTLAKALDKNVMYNNSYFKRLGSKIHF